jgi:hypothetical protein
MPPLEIILVADDRVMKIRGPIRKGVSKPPERLFDQVAVIDVEWRSKPLDERCCQL